MVHMWFGNLVTMKWWNDLWLNESFADYLSYYAMSKGKLFSDSLEHFFSRKDWAYMQDQLSTTHPIVASANDTTEAFSNFDGISYAKGASVLKQLMFYIGEKNFKTGIRIYLKKFYEKNTVLNDFLSCMSQSSGEDIVSWSKQWLETTGVNTLIFKNNGTFAYIEQLPSRNNNQLRDHVVKYESFAIIKNIVSNIGEGKVTIKSNKTKFCLNQNNEFLLLNAKDHDYVKVFFEENDIEFISKYVSSIDDRFSRRIIWGNLWQMVRDDALSPIRFLELIEKHINLEKDITVCQNQLVAKVIATISTFLTNENKKLWCDRFYSCSSKTLKNIGSIEKQNTFFDLLLYSATSKKSLTELYGILNDDIIIKNLDIDQDKRWRIIHRLCIYNFCSPKNIVNKEIINDPGDLGSKKAYLALSSIKDEKTKSNYWHDFIGDDNSNSTDYIRYGMSGFIEQSQEEILTPYIDLYFKSLIKIYTEKDLHYSSAFGKLLFPDNFKHQTILQKTNGFLKDNKNIPKLCKKQLIEKCDDLKRQIPIIEKQNKINLY